MKLKKIIALIIALILIIPNTIVYSATSVSPDSSDITIVNNLSGTPDTVTVKASGLTTLLATDVVKVYPDSSATPGTEIGTGTAASVNGVITASISISQLSTSSGQVWVTIQSGSDDESSATPVSYAAEPTAPDDNDVTIVNNYAGIADTINIVESGQTTLLSGDTVKVYADSSGNPGIQIGSAVAASISGVIKATITINQLGTGAGQVWISVKSSSMVESPKTPVVFSAEPSAPTPDVSDVSIVNNLTGTPDSVKLVNSSKTPLLAGDILKVYKDSSNSPGSILGNAKAASVSGSISATVSIGQLGITSGQVWVSILKSNGSESAKVAIPYLAEPISTPLQATNVTIVNNADKNDTINVTGLALGDVVKVYSDDTVTTTMAISTGAAVVNNTTTASISLSQIGPLAGTVYLSVTSIKMNESTRVPVNYNGEPATPTPSGVVVVNNVDPSYKDTITLNNVNPNDTLKAYSDPSLKNLLGYKTVASGSTSAVISLPSNKLGAAGSIYVTLKTPNYRESDPLTVPYSGEVQTATPTAIHVYNYSGCPDVVTVGGLNSGDTVKIWNTSANGTVLKSGTVKNNKTNISINIAQLGKGSGSIWISVKGLNQDESGRAKADYNAELK